MFSLCLKVLGERFLYDSYFSIHMKAIIYFVKGWQLKPFKYGRPFVKLEDYDKLKEIVKKLRKQVRELKNG